MLTIDKRRPQRESLKGRRGACRKRRWRRAPRVSGGTSDGALGDPSTVCGVRMRSVGERRSPEMAVRRAHCANPSSEGAGVANLCLLPTTLVHHVPWTWYACHKTLLDDNGWAKGRQGENWCPSITRSSHSLREKVRTNHTLRQLFPESLIVDYPSRPPSMLVQVRAEPLELEKDRLS